MKINTDSCCPQKEGNMSDESLRCTQISSTTSRHSISLDSHYREFRYDNHAINTIGHAHEEAELPAEDQNDELASDEYLLRDKQAKRPAIESVAPRRWVPGVASNMPWKFLFVLLGTLSWAGACIGVIFAANDSKVDS